MPEKVMQGGGCQYAPALFKLTSYGGNYIVAYALSVNKRQYYISVH